MWRPSSREQPIQEEAEHFLSTVLDDTETLIGERVAARECKPLKHILRVNNICERLFSRCKLIMTDNRKHMDPSTLETLLMLYMNKDLWDERNVQWILDHYGDFEEPTASVSGNRRRRESDSEDDDDSDEENSSFAIATTSSSSAITSSSSSNARVQSSSRHSSNMAARSNSFRR